MFVIDNKIPDIFYKIKKFQRTSWASVIMHKDLLDIINLDVLVKRILHTILKHTLEPA